MVLSKRVARFNRVATNQVLKHVAGWAPGFATVVHKGRKSGREFRTPINVFRTKDGFVVGLTYGPDADWVKNVLAAGGCTLITRRENIHVHGAELVHDDSRRAMPVPIRQVLGLLDVNDFLLLKRE
ncbi:nitroreductase family deazaflavin-dependent oxidoreductase [Amycolatopsis kentuckyensis]|uniref:nitroreductase family deazaflavin-dependent oxidoreductase n=1 Tax=Amycolatopsis kentuckyensis TaxID=218823 RepID=UPI000A3A9314|nr:nitroreductase family deazaflavin-dependent oxidoreductase [Amycolatopsis kentuckyensis]